jgi:hypothetical protein
METLKTLIGGTRVLRFCKIHVKPAFVYYVVTALSLCLIQKQMDPLIKLQYTNQE